jgi:hypothetical protein
MLVKYPGRHFKWKCVLPECPGGDLEGKDDVFRAHFKFSFRPHPLKRSQFLLFPVFTPFRGMGVIITEMRKFEMHPMRITVL